MTLPPYQPELDAISWIEDPGHGPSRPKSWRCWVIFWRPCTHRMLTAAVAAGRAGPGGARSGPRPAGTTEQEAGL